MVETLIRPDQRIDAMSIGGSPRARAWTPAVACMGVALLVASMTALNTALGDLAVATSATQSQLNWIVDGYTVALACHPLQCTNSAARCPSMTMVACGPRLVITGRIAPSITQRLSMP